MPFSPARPHYALYLAAILILAMAAYGPIPQLAHYHEFADQRSWLGISHAADVVSNLGFLLVAAYGALRMRRSGAADGAQALFCAALALTALGSSRYHLAPDDARLVWDRLPIALACSALLAAGLRGTYPKLTLALPALAALAGLSVWWWTASGDLRPYLALQAAPLLLIPVLQWQSGAPMAQRRAFALAIALYVLAKLFEVGDRDILDMLGVFSGHTLKHILATVAALVLVRQFPGARTLAVHHH